MLGKRERERREESRKIVKRKRYRARQRMEGVKRGAQLLPTYHTRHYS